MPHPLRTTNTTGDARPARRDVEVVLRWGGDVVDVRRLDDGVTRLRVGCTPGDDLFVPLDVLAGFELLVRRCDGWELRTPPGVGGTISRRGVPAEVSAATGALVPLDDDVEARLVAGSFTIEVSVRKRARLARLAPVFDALWANTATVTMSAMAIVVAIATLVPRADLGVEDDLHTNPARYASLIAAVRPSSEPGEPRRSTEVPPQTAATVGKQDSGRRSERGTELRRREQPAAQRATIALEMLGGDGGVAGVFGTGPAEGLVEALGAIDGMQNAAIFAGPIVGPSPPRGEAGAPGLGTIAIGRVGTRGRGTGADDYGAAGSLLDEKAERELPDVKPGAGMVIGSLDKELIRRVVKEHESQIRYCYERALQETPGLAGKVSVRWVIDTQGRVTEASARGVAGEVEECIEERVRRWHFPLPKGGGVVVQYPFVLKQG